ncbi:uncharacterized protein LOC117640402 isoform X1 [Thrips palmi]|uniref:Uncharacterized protein LOC117640402 isoform X1 n=1 Tax=Thrips palmi TaxID=161013 RepID=A0A6P8Y823_THRPL|nr:uncharacterized protein LOC117640402 isoform X1 [Thrips palmi]XP_034232773.1 uncharacterized protein LOC117640402 isoform X1 [Thrips palmi]XP_034232774.1 uncharacterized protein LOC117640402 isoform X1 [Thrips palmi]XP_034232775.1 uncharacterized protein LOC117640402 isoform X1 [Thrips palmi]XP_034232776.1 uncharacterized protein LOC117640402 isoform X1 [Thrips palmi]XP_034232777.1 uncharacterized protein LOC117640402 isoform X1 [Thrips palmi]XP_034232780.1 uncharacterized protein LOC11764
MDPREPPRKRRAERRATENAVSDDEKAMVCWSALPSVALEQVFGHLGMMDVVSAGQTCRSWRTTAMQPAVWKDGRLLYSWVFEDRVSKDLPRTYSLRHRNARDFVRIVRFAPRLHWLKTADIMLPAARKALTHSKLKLFGLGLNGRLAWSAKLLAQKQDGLEQVTLRNPDVACLLAALRCRDMLSLKLEFSRDEKYSCPVLLPGVPVQREKPLKALITDGGEFPEAVSMLVERFADTLEGLHVSCLPSSAALSRCTRLRTLGVNPDPGSARDRSELLAGLRGKKLRFIGFKGVNEWVGHSKEDCLAFREELKQFVWEGVYCRQCA